MSSPRILDRIDGLRRRVRTLVLATGLLAFLGYLSAGFLVIGALDWLLWLPSAVRLALILVLLGGLGFAAINHLLRPLAAPLTRVALAGRIEQTCDGLGNRLSSAVQFLEDPPLGSRSMMDEVVRRADAALDDVNFADAFSYRVVRRRAGGVLTAGVVLVALSVLMPYWPATALARMIHPFGSELWPRTVRIVPATQGTKVPFGGSFTTEMHIARGDRPDLRAYVHTRDEKGVKDVLPMQRSEDGTYRWTLEGLTRKTWYWFEAGDDNTEPHPGLLDIVRRPAFESIRLQVQSPSYAAADYELRLPPDRGRVQVLAGSRVRLLAQVSKPVRADETGAPQAYLLTEDGQQTPMSWADESRRRLLHEFELNEPVGFQIMVCGRDGFWNEALAEYELVPRPDQPPRITVLEPTATLEVTPHSTVDVRLSLSDDIGLAGLRLHAQKVGAPEPWPPVDLGEALDEAARVPNHASQAPTNAREPDKREVSYTWELASLELKPGDVLPYELQVADNFALDGAGPHSVRSVPLRLKILSQAQFTDRLQADFQMLRAKLRELLDEQETLQDSADQVRENRSAEQMLPREVAESLGRVAGAQSRLSARTAHLSRRFEQMVSRMQRNRYDDPTARQDTSRIAHELRQVAGGAMTEAARLADEARQAVSPDRQDRALGDLVRAQHRSTDALERLLAELQRWGSFQEMVRKTREVLDRQQELTRRTAEAHRKTLGIPPESLDTADKEHVARLARRQRRLAEESEELMRRMSDLAGATRDTEPASSESLSAAARGARAGMLSRRLQKAALAIRRNQARKAAADQKIAEELLSKMLDRLQNKQSRQLAELVRKAERAEELVRYLLQQQVQLQESTRTTVAQDALPDEYAALAQEQQDLEGNTRQLSKDLSRRLDTAQAARHIRRAAGKMQSAASRLAQARGEQADTSQSAAIEELNGALQVLRELREQAQRKLAEQAVLALRHKLIEIHDAQVHVAAEYDQVRQALKSQGRLRRRQTRLLSRMAKTQAQLKSGMEGIIEQVADVVVHRWLFERISRDIAAAGRRMEQRVVDEETATLLQKIIDTLARAIDSLDVSDVQPEDQFAQAGGGGAGGMMQRIKPVPTVAELKLLRQLQRDINAQTAELDRSIGGDRPTEKQLRQVRGLSRQQHEVRELTTTLFERQH